MTSQPIGSFEVGGSWDFDGTRSVTGAEGTTCNMTGGCVVSFADSSHIEIAVLAGNRMRFEDPSHQLTCDLQLADDEKSTKSTSLKGTVLHNGSVVSTVAGEWGSALLFDKWECWHVGQHETGVCVVGGEEEEGEGEV